MSSVAPVTFKPVPPAAELPRDPRIAAFARDGFLGPVRVLAAAECRRITDYLESDGLPAAADWRKGRAVHERLLYEVAVHPAILTPVTMLLGENVVLWGAHALRRQPGEVHPWHSDIESCDPGGRFVTVWIGLEHTSRESALQVISRSHKLGVAVQQARAARGLRRDETTPAAMLALTREREPEALLIQPEMTDGDALLFDGRLWHGSDNARKEGRRLALLLQYAAPECAIRIPDLAQLDWPFRFVDEPRPRAIVVSGTADGSVNRLVPPPPPGSHGAPMVASAIHRFDLPLENPSKPWQPFPAFRGPSRTVADMSCHASVLTPGGHVPHPPHAHREEELLMPLHGEVEILIARNPEDPAPHVERLDPGALVYYPAGQHHTIRNVGASPAAYLMFKWYAPPVPSEWPLRTEVYRHGDVTPPAGAAPFWKYRIFEGPTGCLRKLHSHITVLEPGAGYEPHVDGYDVAIVTLAGRVETLGKVVEPMSVIYYAAGEPHGMRNVGTEPARYLVFEFHGAGVEIVAPEDMNPEFARRAKRLLKAVARPVWREFKRRYPALARRLRS